MLDIGCVDLAKLHSKSEVRGMHETVLDDLNDAERELEALLNELKANRTAVREEAHSLFSLTKQFVRRSEELEVGVATRQGTRGNAEPTGESDDQ